MGMLSQVALAMNPNLTNAEFLELVEKDCEAQKRLFDTLMECAEKLPLEYRATYVAQCLPLII